MSITFNADEIFEMAEEIERNGAKFYRQAAERTSDKKIKQMLLDLAAMEKGHLCIFQEMRGNLSEEEKTMGTFDPDNEASLYLHSMAETHGSEGKISPTQELTGKETVEELLKIAVDAEKNSVVFYVGLKSLVPGKNSRDNVEKIIREEMGHLAKLNQQLAAIKWRH
jgi:rubrerythrin